MRAWLNQHWQANRLAWRRLKAAPINTLLSMLAIGIALALPVGGLMLFSNLQRLGHSTSAQPQISLFLKLDADKKAVSDIAARLKQNSALESFLFLPREKTLANMRRSEGMSEVLDALPRNPFPDAFIITPAHADADEMERLATEWRGWQQVEHVQIDSAWVKRLGAMLRLGRTLLLALSAMLGLGLIAITFNTIRLQMITLKSEIEVSRLLGATDTFISRPFFYFGVGLCLLGGATAWAIIATVTLALRLPVNELATLYGLDVFLGLPDPGTTLILFLAAGGLGWLGTALSLSQHLRRPTIR